MLRDYNRLMLPVISAFVGFFDRVFANHPNACLFDDAKKAIEDLESRKS